MNLKLEKPAVKLIFAGLDAVGKTSIQKVVFNELLPETQINPKPTTWIERNFEIYDGNPISSWDFGGQKEYRKRYLKNHALFKNTTALIYVIDIQSQIRCQEALDYLKNLLNVFIFLRHYPRIFVLLHKYDPDLVSDFRAELYQLSTKINELKKDFCDNFKITNLSTSIFSDKIHLAFRKILLEVLPNLENKRRIDVHQQKIDKTLNKTKTVDVRSNNHNNEQQFVDQKIESLDSNDSEEQTANLEIVNLDFLVLKDKLQSLSISQNTTSIETTLNEVILPLMSALQEYLTTRMKKAIEKYLISKNEYETAHKFISSLGQMKSEFAYFVRENNLKSYEIQRKFPIFLGRLINHLLDMAFYNELVNMEERSSIRLTVAKLSSKFD